ncbi:hypothetical protein Ancab_010242, partial [Ancistrocladus abbreviatus]
MIISEMRLGAVVEINNQATLKLFLLLVALLIDIREPQVRAMAMKRLKFHKCKGMPEHRNHVK